ncbi:MAG: LTA synthase family protein [Desulfobulbaceae bacterium]
MKNRLSLIFLGIPFILPAIWRLVQEGGTQPIGLLSDLALGVLALMLALLSPLWLRVPMLLIWALFQATAHELYAAMHRLPSWQDVHYLFDPTFVKNSTAGFHLASPWPVALLLLSAVFACLVPVQRPRAGFLGKGFALALALFVIHGVASNNAKEQSLAARYNPLQWLLTDALSMPLRSGQKPVPLAELPLGLTRVDLNGAPLIQHGRAKNVLIVLLEGIPGLYYPEIREAMGVESSPIAMTGLAENTRNAMLIPDFVAHSHQTIRGLYSILCGDVSELSYKTPKAIDLLGLPEQAKECLPARMADNGWDTHFLQGAGLTFMSKDRVMPNIGFQEVHGNEWFSGTAEDTFEWGVIDSAFFKGAGEYITELQAKNRPWLLTLLTVGTHQPYSVPDAVAARYPSRKDAAVALLDQAVAQFIKGLRQDGVLDDTLVIITSDESHGNDLAEWMCSWGMAIVLAPEQEQLPRLHQDTFGLMDIAASVLDYFRLDIPAAVIGRSFFRDYNTPREMVAYTAGKLRWHTSQDLLFECTLKDGCLVGKAKSLLGSPPEGLVADTENRGPGLFAAAAALDNKLIAGRETRRLEFASGEIRTLPEKVGNEWADNLVGAQYLDFPANSKVHVSIRVKAIQAQENGVQLKLSLRQWEHLVTDIPYSDFPLLHTGEETTVEFDFVNPVLRESFSFHLTGEGRQSAIQIKEFNVTVM